MIRFGVFELNSETGELRKRGIRLKLAEQPFRVLNQLVSRPGEIVTREEFRRLLWGDDTFVDFDHGLNASINKLRETLGDSASTPRYIETVPRRGYRFVAELGYVPAPKPEGDVAVAPEAVPEVPPSGLSTASRKFSPWRWASAATILILAGAGGAWLGRSRPSTAPPRLVMRPLTADTGLTTQPVLSRDGKLVAYASDRATSKNLDIWVHPLTEGGQPIRLTTDEADDLWPDFSPDGGLITFQSQRDGGGIYLVPTLGGEERLLVRGGRRPRFSPDGKSIAYTVGGDGLIQSKIYIIPVSGGAPRELATDVPWASLPVFSPDGQHVLFEGAFATGALVPHDWWVAPLAGGPSMKTGALAILNAEPYWYSGIGADLLDGGVLFAFDGRIWQMDLAGPDWKARGPARPLTAGSAFESARAGGNARMTFGSTQHSAHLWRLKVDLNAGNAIGEMEPIPHAGGTQIMPSSSADGRLLAYNQRQPDGYAIRLRDLKSGKESTLRSSYGRPKVSPDGSKVAFSVLPGSIYVMPSAGGDVTPLVSPEQKLKTETRGWTPDGKKLVYWFGNPIHFALMDPETRASTDLISHPKLDIYTAEMSPDQRWVAFTTQAGAEWKLWIAAVHDGRAVDEKEWILVNTGQDERPWWSPDGNLLYTVSRRDGSRCIWARRLDPATKRPKGEPFATLHVHGALLRMENGLLAGFGPAVLPDGLIFSLYENSGNVWIAEPEK